MRTVHTIVLAIALAGAGSGIAAWKHLSFGFPLQPDPDTAVWTVEARARLQAHGGPVRVEMPIPGRLNGFTVIDEGFISSSFGAVADDSGSSRRVVWSAREPGTNPVLYYRMQLAESTTDPQPARIPAPLHPEPPQYDEPVAAAVASLLEEVRGQSADVRSFASARAALRTGPVR